MNGIVVNYFLFPLAAALASQINTWGGTFGVCESLFVLLSNEVVYLRDRCHFASLK